MRTVKRATWTAAFGMALVLAAGCCKENPTATAACKAGLGNNYVCKACCQKNGASSNVMINGKCTCTGNK